jgi:hypothetical protein
VGPVLQTVHAQGDRVSEKRKRKKKKKDKAYILYFRNGIVDILISSPPLSTSVHRNSFVDSNLSSIQNSSHSSSPRRYVKPLSAAPDPLEALDERAQSLIALSVVLFPLAFLAYLVYGRG